MSSTRPLRGLPVWAEEPRGDGDDSTGVLWSEPAHSAGESDSERLDRVGEQRASRLDRRRAWVKRVHPARSDSPGGLGPGCRPTQPAPYGAGRPVKSHGDRPVPGPAALARRAATITSAASRRRGTLQAGSSTCAASQRAHQPRRGRSSRSPPSPAMASERPVTARAGEPPSSKVGLDCLCVVGDHQHRTAILPMSRQPRAATLTGVGATRVGRSCAAVAVLASSTALHVHVGEPGCDHCLPTRWPPRPHRTRRWVALRSSSSEALNS